MKDIKLIITINLVFIFISSFAQWEPKTVINQRAINNIYVSDADSNLHFTEIEQLNQILQKTEKETGVQYGVVIVNGISEKWDVMSFGVELYNLWGLGQKDKDNGLLLLIVMNTRDWRFFSGYGVESSLPDALLIRLGKTYIVPAFQENLYGKGLIDVSDKIHQILTEKNVEAAARFHMKYEPWWDTFIFILWFLWLTLLVVALNAMRQRNKKSGSSLTLSNPFKSISDVSGQLVLIPDMPVKASVWAGDNVAKYLSVYLMAGIIPAMASYYDDVFSNPVGNAFVGLYIYLFLLSVIVQYRLNKNAKQISPDEPSRFLHLEEANKLMVLRIIFFPMAFLPYYFFYKRKLNGLKDGKITCRQCSQDALPLVRNEYSQYLSVAEMLEIKLKSRDPRFYKCSGNHITKIMFEGKLASAFRMCSKCSTLTMAKTGEKTLQSASYSSKGEGQREFTCKNCGAIMFTTFVIPMKQRSSSGSGSGSSGSGGGSWGGGRTGGGGAGGRW
ncbi:MAG: TPM domain-containing protein [Lentimicrobium sp.]|nr:TPM domain-containing protein [Lentimicrobium sp.]